MEFAKAKSEPSSSTGSSELPFKVLEPISFSKFPIFKVIMLDTGKNRALKIFPQINNKQSLHFKNEARFLSLKHPNIVRFFAKEGEQIATLNSKFQTISYILMEYAQYGDFAQLALNYDLGSNEILVRTYFHQLIAGVSYLHANNCYHMDLKLDNLLLGDNLNLRLADFDNSYKGGDTMFLGSGTNHYRAPELLNQTCCDLEAADIYSLGIILFTLVVGHFPYLETSNNTEEGKLWSLMLSEDERFWNYHTKKSKNPKGITKSFKALFKDMTKKNPEDRVSLHEIKKSEWFQGTVYLKHELETVMKKLLYLPEK